MSEFDERFSTLANMIDGIKEDDVPKNIEDLSDCLKESFANLDKGIELIPIFFESALKEYESNKISKESIKNSLNSLLSGIDSFEKTIDLYRKLIAIGANHNNDIGKYYQDCDFYQKRLEDCKDMINGCLAERFKD